MKKGEGTALLDATNEYEYDANLTDINLMGFEFDEHFDIWHSTFDIRRLNSTNSIIYCALRP